MEQQIDIHAKISNTEQDILEVKEQVRTAAGQNEKLLHLQRLNTLQQRLNTLEQQKLELLKQSGAATAATTSTGADGGARHTSEAAAWVDKLMVGGQTIGSIVRISEEGLCVTAAHCLVDGGKFLEGASAFGGVLTLAGSSPFHDVMFVQGPPGCAVELQQAPLLVGQAVAMVGYPLAADQALGTKEHPTTLPIVAHGQVVATSPTNELVAADYCSTLPNASGSAVLLARQLAGVHVGAFFHLDATHKAEEEDEPAPADRWDTDAAAMWHGSCREAQGKRRATGQPAAAAQDLNNLALHAAANILHKAQLALFVPASVIWRLAQHGGLMGLTAMDVVQRKHAANS